MKPPDKCPKCGSTQIGQIDKRNPKIDSPDYPSKKHYCITCGWMEGDPDKKAVSIRALVAYFGFGRNASKFFKAINAGEDLEVEERTNHGNFKIIIKKEAE